MNSLPDSWTNALKRMANARVSRVYMPAALLVVLDMLEEGRSIDGVILFEEFEERFRTLIRKVRPSGASKAWQPFYHLTNNSRIWRLTLGDQAASFDDVPDGRPNGRSSLLKHVDRAVLVDEFRPAIEDPTLRIAIRDAIYDLLRGDDAEESEGLIRAHTPNS